MHKNIKNITNRKFGKLVAIRNTMEKEHNSYIWECICDCGNIINVVIGSLNSGNTKSCGCVNAKRLSKLGTARKLPNNEGAVNSLYYKYKQSAKRKNISFSISKDEFKNLIYGDCFYCGDKPSRVFKQHKCDVKITCNGIDRIDTKIGYDIDNCCTCCKQCNTMKMDYSLEDFYKKIKQINDRITNIKILP